MTKIVVNKMHGGFGLSDAAIRRYAAIKELTLWIEPRDRFTDALGPVYWTKPPGERGPILSDEEFYQASMEERQASNEAYRNAELYHRDIPRDDPALVQVVEELGEAANGQHASLEVVEIPDDVEWRIEEYDGLEWIAEAHRTW